MLLGALGAWVILGALGAFTGWAGLAGCCWSGVEEGVEEEEEGEEGLKLVRGSVFGRCARAPVPGDSRR